LDLEESFEPESDEDEPFDAESEDTFSLDLGSGGFSDFGGFPLSV